MFYDFFGGQMVQRFSRVPPKDLAEYRMTKHVFGEKSSSSIEDFCVKKTAELESDGIERE